MELQTSVKQDDTTRTRTPKPGYLNLSNESKATGLDKIPAKLLKNCASSVCSSLCVLFNKSLSLGKLPYEWKLGMCRIRIPVSDIR
jgi:hypothetical protein